MAQAFISTNGHQLTTSRRQSSVAVRAQQQQHTAGEHAVRVLGSQAVTRRQVGAGVLAGLSAVIVGTGPAQAGLFGDPNVKYTEQTSKMIANMKAALEMPTDDPNKEETMKALRQETITWVSAYRRDPKFSGRPSYSNLYTAINALDGQLNSFGLTSRISTKRLDRINKEIADADRQLQRGR